MVFEKTIDSPVSTDTLNLRHLRALKTVHQAGSITAAAELTFLSQPAITQGIAKLEAAFGAKLFLRGRKGMAPTPAGDAVARRVDRALAILSAGCLKAAQRARAHRDTPFDLSVTAKQLRALVAMARHGSFSAAARDLGVAQPSLHRIARDLEHVAGFALYEKTSSGIALTPGARILDRAAKLTFAELRQAFDEVRAGGKPCLRPDRGKLAGAQRAIAARRDCQTDTGCAGSGRACGRWTL